MPSITELIRSLGNDRAIANAHHEILRIAREDWLVASLTHRLDSMPAATPLAPVASIATPAA
ncbi:MAG: hypothetical protein WD691_04375 [Acidimicrobiales bacterium]